MNDNCVSAGIAVLIMVVAFWVMFYKMADKIETLENNAIKTGVAEYFINEDNDKEFRFIDKCKEIKK